MARDLPRTPADDIADALAALDALEGELPNLRAHLTAPGPVEPATMWQAARVARILAAKLDEASKHASHAAERAAAELRAAS